MQKQETSKGFDIVLKVAERCNLACPYCYYFFLEYNGAKNTPIMTEETAQEIPYFLQRSADKLNLKRLNVVLHGGEPLLMKKPRLDALCTDLRNALDDRVELTLAVQSNGVLIDDEWIDLFAKHDINVGVSLDGPQKIHDKGRPDHSGRGSYERTVLGLKQLQQAVEAGRLDRSGTLSVLSAKGGNVLKFLVEELGSNSPNLNYPRGGWDFEDVLEWDKQVENHREIVRYCLENYIYPDFHYVRGITDMLFAIKSEKGAQRSDARNASRHFIATISSEGRLLVDDNILGIGEIFDQTDLNIFGTSLLDLIHSPQWQMLHRAVDHIPDDCHSCEWVRACRGGELYNRYDKRLGFARKSAICETLKMIYEEAAAYLVRKKIVTVEELAALLERPATISAKETVKNLIKEAVHQHEGAYFAV